MNYVILDASNQPLVVTNIGSGMDTSTLTYPPLGAVGASATGEVAMKVITVGSSGAGSGATSATASYVQEKEYSTVSTSAIGTTDATVFTLSAGEKGWIQNLDTTALAVKLGAGASATSLNYILKAGTAADDGLGGSIAIDDWVGAVSVFDLSGGTAPRYTAWKLS